MSKIYIEATPAEQIVKVMKGQKKTHSREFWAGILGACATLIDGVNKGLDTRAKVIDQRIKIREIEDKAAAAAKQPFTYTEQSDIPTLNGDKKYCISVQEILNYSLAASKAGQDFCKALAINSSPSKGELDLTGKMMTNEVNLLNEINGLLNKDNKREIVNSAYQKAKRAKEIADNASFKQHRDDDPNPTQDDESALFTAKSAIYDSCQKVEIGYKELTEAFDILKRKDLSDKDRQEALKFIDEFNITDIISESNKAATQAEALKKATKAWKYRKFADNLCDSIENDAYDNISTAFQTELVGPKADCKTNARQIKDDAVTRKANDASKKTPDQAKEYYDFMFGAAQKMRALLTIAINLASEQQKDDLKGAMTLFLNVKKNNTAY